MGSPDIKALLREAMDHLNDPSRYWGCDKASDFERRVNAALATPTPPAPLVHPEVCAFCGIITTDAEPSDGTKYVCRDTQSCIDRARKACGLPPKPAPADDARPMVTGGGLIKFDRRADDASGAEAMRRFPIIGGPSIPWWVIAQHEAQAMRNHGGQTLERLAERGGLSPTEALCVIEDRAWSRGRDARADHDALSAMVIEWDRPAPLPARADAVEEAMAPGCHEHVALWDAINAYSAACGGHPTRGGGARMDAVVRVEKALRAALRREKESRSDDSRPASGQGRRVMEPIRLWRWKDRMGVTGATTWHDSPLVDGMAEYAALPRADFDALAAEAADARTLRAERDSLVKERDELLADNIRLDQALRHAVASGKPDAVPSWQYELMRESNRRHRELRAAATARADKAETERDAMNAQYESAMEVIHRNAGARRDGLCGILAWIDRAKDAVALLRDAYDAIRGEADFPLKDRIKAFLMEKANG